MVSLFSISVYAQKDNAANSVTNNVTIYFFWSKGCPHCAAEKTFLKKLEDKYPKLKIESYEISESGSVERFLEIAKVYGANTQWVPATFICDTYTVGFDDEKGIGKEIEDKVKNCLKHGCTDLYKLGEQEKCDLDKKNIVNIPFLGERDLTEIGLPLLTVVLGLLDSFNPCAIWVLCFLLTLLLYTRSRTKMLVVGLTFVLTSGIIYFLFMAAWLNFFLMIGFVTFLRILVAIIAIIAGIINIKDFFFFKAGISLTIPEKLKFKLSGNIRKLIRKETFLAIILGTIILAFLSNSFELICTFGFPAIYTRALTLHALPPLTYYFYLALYNIIYILPLLVITGIAILTMSAHKFTEKQGKVLKLISGLLMLLLGLIMLIKPTLLMFG